ncbi:T-cell differentiation antigen CD6 [Lacerta agilis]|uniref:T-cell differentiation antigen CD6 n=1 Tax=Lacerta agilis TaxID=80427 RepID=UPI00141A0047|nr:T-cell differentiation antigen CD6 [Lacerta agilis]
MDLMEVLLMTLSLMAIRKVQAKPTGSPAIGNSTEGSPTAEPETRKLRLVGGRSNCSGRVEVEFNGTWGTICDDNWDLADAGVVCRQLHCGWALQAPIASHFQKGTGPIYLDEVKCLGNESFLWDCSFERNHDCGHKEDAGVICSEHQEWRLSEGLDACAGRVEVYYRGTWNTVCDGNWYQDEADVLCHSLNCSEKASAPRVPFSHTLMGKMYYACSGTEKSLASCTWLYNNSNVCAAQFAAAGVICNGSRGLAGPANTQATEAVTPVSHLTSPRWTAPENLDVRPSYQILQILCIVLGLLLLLAILTLIITILRHKRRENGTIDSANLCASTAAPILLNHSMQVSATGTRNNYQQVPTSLPKEEATAVLPTPLSEDSDSDYEHYDFNSKPPLQLSTFYSEHLTTARNILFSYSFRNRVTDEDPPRYNFAMPAMHEEGDNKHPTSEAYPQAAGPAAEDSDSTSSGDADWYENIQKPEQQESHPGNEPSFGGSTTSPRPLVNCKAGPGNSSFDSSSDYDDMWA